MNPVAVLQAAGPGPAAGATTSESGSAGQLPAAGSVDRAQGDSRQRRYRFLGYRIDPAARLLTFAGTPIAVQPKAFEVIVHLLENRERAVGRDELIATIWGRVDVADAALAQAMLIARRALNDTGRDQSIIRTVFRFGYQWIAPVEIESVVPRHGEAALLRAPRAVGASSVMRRHWRVAAIGSIVLAALCGVVLLLAVRPA